MVGLFKRKQKNNFRNVMYLLNLAMLLLLVTNCTGKKEIIINTYTQTNKEIINQFVNMELLKDIVIKQMYPVDNIINVLGSKQGETIELANIDYEGMKGKTLRKIEFNKYYAIIYQLDNGREIFGNLLLKNEFKYSKFNIGTDIRNYININGDSINKWNKNNITIYGTYNIDWDMELTITYDDAYKIKEVEVRIGGI